MGFRSKEYAQELETRPDTVTLAKAIHAAWILLPDLHSCDTEQETDWEKIGQYLRWKFLLAADQAEDTMQWTKIDMEEPEIASHRPTQQTADVIAEIERTHRLVPIDLINHIRSIDGVIDGILAKRWGDWEGDELSDARIIRSITSR